MSAVRVFFIGGYLAYRALFNWIHPGMYIPTMLAGPVFQVLFFAYVGRFVGLQDDAFFVVGNAIVISAMAGVFGMAMAIGGERWTQTLSALLATPANRVGLVLGRALPFIANGIFVSAFGFFCGWLLLDFDPPASSLPVLALIIAVSATSCTALGLCVGSVGLRARDVFFLANLVDFLLILLTGANVPLEAMPDWMQDIARVLPMTHGIEAGREVAAGAAFADVDHLIGTELVIAVVYGAFGYSLFRFFEFEGRRRASLETI
jgi:ABC-2 type transport system permease protein